MSELVIDCREAKLIEKLNNEKVNNENINYIVKQLYLGDIILECDQIPKIIIERKTENDLISSIIDGRFRDQKNRLIEFRNKTNIDVVYIIELSKYPIKFKKNKISAVINLAFKHNFKVFYSENVLTTMEIILSLQEKLDSGTLIENNSPQIVPKTSFALIKKGEFLDPFIKILLSIDGISILSAKRIFEKYKKISELSQAIKELPETAFDNIKLNKPVKEKLKILFS
jgi:ERCC4-type nuclease